MNMNGIKFMIIAVSSVFLLAASVSCVDEKDDDSGKSSDISVSVISGYESDETENETSLSGSFISGDTDSDAELSLGGSGELQESGRSSDTSYDAGSQSKDYTSDSYQNIIDELDELEDVINDLDDFTSDDFLVPEP